MKKGWTLIEVIIIIAIIAIVLAVAIPIATAGCSAKGTSPEQEMQKYLSTLYPNYTVVGISCTSQDSDGDGYVSCSATLEDPSNPGKIVRESAECANSYFYGGCKIAMPKLGNNQPF